jgi:ABC-type multidrug transport system fused ATPase/permease subunit
MEMKGRISPSEYIKIIIKVLKLLFRSSKLYTSLILIVNIFIGIIVPINVVIWKNFINSAVDGIADKSWQSAVFWIVIYSLIYIIDNILSKLNEFIENILASKVNIFTTKLILDRLVDIPMEFFDNSENHDKIQKINTESNSRSMSILRTLVNLIKSFNTMIGTIIILLQFSPLLIIICFITCVPTLIISMKMAYKQFNIYNTRFENLRYISYLKNMMTMYENIKEMKVNNSIPFFSKRIDKQYNEYLKEDMKIRGKYFVRISGMNTMEQALILLIRIYITISVIIKKQTIGSLSLYISSIDNFRNSVVIILNTIVSIFEDGLYINNLFEFLEMTKQQNNEGLSFVAGFKNIEFKHVWFKYPNTNDYILKDINFVIDAKKSYSIVGLNGSGKTTLIKLILNLYEPDKGEILIDGVNIREFNKKEYVKNVGVVFQDFMKYPLTVSENIGIGDSENIDNFNQVEIAAVLSGANEFIRNLPDKYETKLLREWSGGIQLSLGQWQKLAISRAFMKNYPIIILDEPTASLDAMAEFELYKKFKQMVSGKTCILIAHRFSTIKLADTILVLKDGKIVETGIHEELIKMQGEYAELYNLQAQTYKE